jgi:hypothetical protein
MDSRTLALALLLVAPSAGAFVYTESADGELGGQSFEFDAGTKHVTGGVHFLGGLGGPVANWSFDSDDFYFHLPAGTGIIGITLSWHTDLDPATTYFMGGVNFTADMEDSEGPTLVFRATEYDFMLDQTVQPFSVDIPPEANIFRLFMFTNAGVRGPVGSLVGGTVNYDWTVRVGERVQALSVPEPGTLALLALGFVLALRTKSSPPH